MGLFDNSIGKDPYTLEICSLSMKAIIRYFWSTILIGVLLIKISAFHVCEHHDSLEHSKTPCENCLLVINVLELEGILTPIEAPKLFRPEVLSAHKLVFATTWYKNKKRVSSFHCRPPPLSFTRYHFKHF